MGIYIEDTREQTDVYKEGALVKGRGGGSYGILVKVFDTEINQDAYNVLSLPTNLEITKPQLKHQLTHLPLDDIKDLYALVASPNKYNMTITIDD